MDRAANLFTSAAESNPMPTDADFQDAYMIVYRHDARGFPSSNEYWRLIELWHNCGRPVDVLSFILARAVFGPRPALGT